ncbi:hypothetical protein INT44_004010 [Umbelopsis vinacea]|uniref:Organic hydroperoxide resistance protein n=1 Tax=Umbelopsis vinacea TaxID=44442 RepID=A0A8H7UMQ0_9FUNG|nr:hypothetical protein INT44_004010 [Umbelopsis vinacea]
MLPLTRTFVRAYTTAAIKPLYTAQATAVGGRQGHVKSSDGVLDLQLAMPKSLGGSGEAGKTNPEQLFAAGYSACFQGAMGLVAGKMKVSGSTKVTALVHIGQDASKSLGLAVELQVESSDIEKADLQKIVEGAHKVCPYSRATRDNIEVKLTVL